MVGGGEQGVVLGLQAQGVVVTELAAMPAVHPYGTWGRSVAAGTRSAGSWGLRPGSGQQIPRGLHPDVQAPRVPSHLVWKMWLQGSLLAPVTISSRQMMQTLSTAWSSSGVASGYLIDGKECVRARAGDKGIWKRVWKGIKTSPLTVCSCYG